MISNVADAINYRRLFAIDVAIGLLIFILIPFIFNTHFYNKNENS